MNDSEVLGMLSLMHSAINSRDEEEEETCGVCGYTFKPGDFVHELEIGRQVETVCDMCYHDVLRRER